MAGLQVLDTVSIPVDLDDKSSLLEASNTCVSSGAAHGGLTAPTIAGLRSYDPLQCGCLAVQGLEQQGRFAVLIAAFPDGRRQRAGGAGPRATKHVRRCAAPSRLVACYLQRALFQTVRHMRQTLCVSRLDLKDIKVVTKLGGTVDDSELVPGAVFDHKAAKAAGGPTRVENAKIALVQFHISPPKTDLENNVIISDYAQASSNPSCTPRSAHQLSAAQPAQKGQSLEVAGHPQTRYHHRWISSGSRLQTMCWVRAQVTNCDAGRRWIASSRRSGTTSCRW